MQIIRFLFANAITHIGKSIGFIITMILLTVLSVCIFFLYKNIGSAVQYYSSSSIVHRDRLEITSNNNLLTLFTEDSPGIQKEVIESIIAENWLENIEIFTLIEYPVLAKFSLFSFALETDIPVFALSGGTLSGNEIGISRKMLDYYNTQFAGSNQMFPEMNEQFLIGQNVTITVGGSKLFQIQTQPATPIQGTIASIHPDYPGFGIVLREDLVENRLQEIGQTLGNPYKIIGYMKNGVHRNDLIDRYRNLNFIFDNDKIKNLEEKLLTIKFIFLMIFLFTGGIIFTIILFLLSGIFRELSSIYRMMRTFGVFTIKSRILTLGEPIILTIVGVFLGGILNTILMKILFGQMTQYLASKGLIFPFIAVSGEELSTILCILFSILLITLGLMDEKERRNSHEV